METRVSMEYEGANEKILKTHRTLFYMEELSIQLGSVRFSVKQTVVAKSNHVVGSGRSRARKLLLL